MQKNLSQKKEEELFSNKTKLSHIKIFYRRVISNRNEKSRETYE